MSLAEDYETIQEEFSADGFVGTATYRTAWANRYTYAASLIYELWPRAPWTQARCRSISIRGQGDPQAVTFGAGRSYYNYAHAVLTCRYDNQVQTEDLISECLEPTTEFKTLDYEDFRWGAADGTALKLGEEPGKLVRSFDYVLTRYEVLQIHSAYFELIGHVNNAPVAFKLIPFTAPAETLQYNPPTLTRKITTGQVEAWQLVTRFAYQPNGWNKYWRQETEQYERMYHKSKADEPYYNYPLGDFGPLFV